jgi:hypothetical protein
MPNHVKTPERSFQFRKPLNLCVTVANQFTVKLPTAIVRPQPRVPLTKSVKEPGPSRPVTVTVPLVLPTQTSEPERLAPAFATAAAMLRIDQQGNRQVRMTSPGGTTTLNYPRSFTTVNPEHITKTTIHRFTTPSTHISYQGLRQAQPSLHMLRHTHTIIRVPADQRTIQNDAPNEMAGQTTSGRPDSASFGLADQRGSARTSRPSTLATAKATVRSEP